MTTSLDIDIRDVLTTLASRVRSPWYTSDELAERP